MSQRRPPRQTQLTASSWGKARPAEPSSPPPAAAVSSSQSQRPARPARQTQLTRDSWREARPNFFMSSSQTKLPSQSSSEEEHDSSDHDLSHIKLAPKGSNPSPRRLNSRLPGTQRRIQTDSEDEDSDVQVLPSSPAPPARATRSSVVTNKKAKQKTPPPASDPDSDSDSSIEFVGSRPPTPDRPPSSRTRNSKQNDEPKALSTPKRKGRRQADSDSSSNNDNDSDTRTPRKKARTPRKPSRTQQRRPQRLDPDDEDAPDAETEDEGVAEIQLDEPERFKTDTRLRQHKSSAFQANLQRLRGKRTAAARGQPASPSTVASSGDEEDEQDSEDEVEDSDASLDFIASDDDSGPELALPEEFTFKRESPEFKFKVVFQYMIMLVVKGPDDTLPLRGEADAYFGRQLRDVRKMMRGLRDSMAGSIWRPAFRAALETYPVWKQGDLDDMETYCDACNRRNQKCYVCAWLRGKRYDPETHEDKEEEDDDDDDDDDNDDSDDENKPDPRNLGNFGSTCLQRARDFHELSHWEHQLFLWVRRRYHALLRAKARTPRSERRGPLRSPSFDSLASDSDDSAGGRRDRGTARLENNRLVEYILHKSDAPLPDDVCDVDQITEWMDACGWQKDSLQWLDRRETRARALEGHH